MMTYGTAKLHLGEIDQAYDMCQKAVQVESEKIVTCGHFASRFAVGRSADRDVKSKTVMKAKTTGDGLQDKLKQGLQHSFQQKSDITNDDSPIEKTVERHGRNGSGQGRNGLADQAGRDGRIHVVLC
ncbi:hypothetical protein OS493_028429 [Desmophyllum pertusum]|uniref:Uncharacterized protein n=1 Tax=Desmophyllum pertusum TaxID=174260 RepID=A0A9X0D1M4_9CNID|nr:hypothetical protein OS493_028429 [Desmophyllum pertusum]